MDEVYTAGRPEGFHFEVHFTARVHAPYRPAIRAAADRWAALVTGPRPPAHGPVMVVTARAMEKKYLASTNASRTWPADAGALAGRPSRVEITLNGSVLASLPAEHLQQVAAHEMGHGLGMALAWRGFLEKHAEGEWVFTGKQAMIEYGTLLGAGPTAVPVDYEGLSTHWRATLFAGEMMNAKLGEKILPISRLTLASLRDLGYEVKIDAADAFTLKKKP